MSVYGQPTCNPVTITCACPVIAISTAVAANTVSSLLGVAGNTNATAIYSGYLLLVPGANGTCDGIIIAASTVPTGISGLSSAIILCRLSTISSATYTSSNTVAQFNGNWAIPPNWGIFAVTTIAGAAAVAAECSASFSTS